jgi:two-component SAPR family response regulator
MSTPHSNPLILIVEDAYLVGLQLKADLESVGAEVVGPVPTVAKALELLERHSITCAILDVNLGHEDSTPIAQKLQDSNIPFLFITGYRASDVATDEFTNPVVLRKPVGPSQIRDGLAKIGAKLPPRAA